MLETRDILETINMIDNENLDVRTITMGISLLDCIDDDIDKACDKVYDKICRSAKDLVKTGEDIEKEFGIPIINKRISVTPIGMVAAPCQSRKVVKFAYALDKAAKELGVNFIGGYSALVQKGFASGDYALIESIPEALSETDFVCSSVNIGSTKAGINMDAVKMMGKIVRQTAEMTADRNCIGAAKLVIFCNAPEDNPFMAREERHGQGYHRDCRSGQKNRIQNHPHGSARRKGSQQTSLRTLWHRRPLPRAHSSSRRFGRLYSRGNGSGKMRVSRHHRSTCTAQ